MNKDLFIKYAEIKNQMKALKEQENEINKQVIEEMESDGVVKAQSDFGTFSIVSRKTYKFKGDVEININQLKDDVKKMEKSAIENGHCEETTYNSLRYQNVKD